MKLKRFQVEGFKSLYGWDDCVLTDLQPVNIFHGENNVGKSNLLEAIDIFCQMVTHLGSSQVLHVQRKYKNFQKEFGFGRELFSWSQKKRARFRGLIEQRGTSSAIDVGLEITDVLDQGSIRCRIVHPTAEVLQSRKEHTSAVSQATESLLQDLNKLLNNKGQNGFYRIHADRRLERENVEPGTTMRPSDLSPLHPSGDNLKQWLLWASVSRDPGERRAFEKVLRPLFADPPLSLGTLVPVAAPGEPYDLQLETSERSIPIDQLGSGIQQLALLGGMIALSQSWIVAIEEPEINLSWPTQEKLKHILRKMVRDTANPPTQFFLSSHSPIFEFYERYFRVEMEDGRTKVTSVPNERREEEFTTISEGRGTMIRESKTPSYEKDGVRVRSGNAVVLPDRVLEALGVSQGDAIYFHRQGDQVLVLNGAQLEELWRPREDE